MMHRIPSEIILKILSSLEIGDLMVASLVCKQWRKVASILLVQRVAVTISDDVSEACIIFSNLTPCYKHWVFKNVDLNLNAPFEILWSQYFDTMQSLALLDVEISGRDLINLLQNCCHLKKLVLTGLSHMLMTGTFLENTNDAENLKEALKNVNSFNLSCSRYVTDTMFSRIISLFGNLKELSLMSCQISFQNSIWKRFYPNNGNVKSSDHVLTFNHILKYIEQQKLSLKILDLSKTYIDSESLIILSAMPDLRLETLKLTACYQLTKGGVQLLAQNQKHLVDLDISLCTRVTDQAVIAVADHLPQLRNLNIRQCQSISEVGLENIARLKELVKLDISHLDIRKWESIHEALGKVHRPTLTYLNAASLPIQWETVIALSENAPNLNYLDLSLCIVGVIDKSIQAICKNLSKLETLYVTGCLGVSDIGLSGCTLGAKYKPVAELSLGSTPISLEALGVKDRDPYRVPLGSKAEQIIRQEAETIKYLEQNVDRITRSSEFGLLHLQKLKHLNLCGCLRMTDLTLIHALRFTELRFLNLSHCQQVMEEGLIQVALNCPSLEELYLINCSYTTDHVALIIAHRLKRIKTLDLQCCILLTNDTLDSLSSCYMLRYLDVSGCNKMTLEGVKHLQKRIPRLLNLHHRGIRSLSMEEAELDSLLQEQMTIPPPPPPLFAKLKKKLRPR